MKTDLFKTWISKKGLKATRQREEILKIFLHSTGHKNLGQIYSLVSKINPKIGYTTVYRTLRLLTQLGLASKRKFADGETRYEPSYEGSHHDHLICLDCGGIIEFEDPTLEALQREIARRHRFKVSHHRMELYGQCERCYLKKGKTKKKD